MKKLISVVLALIMMLSFAGCSLFSDDSIVKLNENFTHEDPEGLKYDKRSVLKKDGFEESIESSVNMAAYPDTMMYDEAGNIIGVYDYDNTTGLAKGWTNMLSGAYTAFPEGEEKDLGKPDASKMIDIPGTVNFAVVLYGNEDKAVASYMYFFLSDASAKEMVKTNLEALFGFKITEISDTVLQAVEDADAIAAKFKEAADFGQTYEKNDADAYAEILKQLYGLKVEGGAVYKPYEGHEDPADLDFDKRVVLTSSGEVALMPKDSKYIASMTSYVYSKDNVVIADYTYYETKSKEDADELMKVIGAYYKVTERVSDTAVKAVTAGKDMEDLVSSYIGYNCMKDNSIDEYVRNHEGTYFSTVCE